MREVVLIDLFGSGEGLEPPNPKVMTPVLRSREASLECTLGRARETSNSHQNRPRQLLDLIIEKIPYCFSKVHSFGENRPGENETRLRTATAVRFSELKLLQNQRDERDVLRVGEFFAKRCWRSEGDSNAPYGSVRTQATSSANHLHYRYPEQHRKGGLIFRTSRGGRRCWLASGRPLSDLSGRPKFSCSF